MNFLYNYKKHEYEIVKCKIDKDFIAKRYIPNLEIIHTIYLKHRKNGLSCVEALKKVLTLVYDYKEKI